jgi:heme-degrading monooxygenase HmoA
MTEIGALYSAGIWTVKPGNEAAFIQTWDGLARWTTENIKDVLPAVLVQDAENPLKFISFGPWKDLDTLTAWRNTPAFRKAFAEFRTLCSEIQPRTMRCVAFAGP